MNSIKLLTFVLASLGISSFASSKSLLSVQYTKSNVTCFGQMNGKIDISISGGKLPYVVQWENGSTQNSLDQLKVGTYHVTVQDQTGQTVEEIITIEAPTPLAIAFNSKKDFVVDALNGSMNATCYGGTPWFEDEKPSYFLRLDGKSNFSNPSELEDGVYKMTIEDAMGCSLTVPVNIDFELASKDPFSNVTKNEVTKVENMAKVKISLYNFSETNLMVSQN